MRLLLDTHSFLWFIDDSPRLSTDARLLIEDPGNDLFLSIASVWEIAIMESHGSGKAADRFVPRRTSLKTQQL